MLLVAQMFLNRGKGGGGGEGGYGAISFDREKGVEWLMRCVDINEGEAREMARRVCPVEFHQWEEGRRRRGETQAMEGEEEATETTTEGGLPTL